MSKVRCSKAVIPSYNEFEESIVKKKDQVIEGDELSKESMKETNSVFGRRATLTKLKIKSHSLKRFKGHNCFSILENNSEEDLDNIIMKRLNIINMKKSLLKKCKTCNFKKRSCMLDRSSCPALKRICFACKKDGHFPRSINCKRSRMDIRSKSLTITSKNQLPAKGIKVSATNLILIKKRISQLETLNQEEESHFNQSEIIKESKNIDLIPFNMMYLFLNYDYFISTSTSKMKVNLIEQARKGTDLKKSILKSAKDCAKHFDNKTNQDQKRNFSVYCSNKVKKILKLKTIPNIDDMDKIQNKLDSFDKIFYVNQEVGDHDQVSSEEVLSDDKCNEDQVSNCDEEEMSDDQVDQFADQNQSNENRVEISLDQVQNTQRCEYQEQNIVEQAKNNEHQVQNGSKNEVCCYVDQYQINVNEGQSIIEDQFNQSDNRNFDLLMNIPQLDGCDEFDLSEKGNMEKQIYGVNCEINEIIQLINFFRSFNFLWISTDSHWLCSVPQECFFCYMRSTCLRLRKEREKGPKMVQLNEFVNQLI